jgi:hypothetical protein
MRSLLLTSFLAVGAALFASNASSAPAAAFGSTNMGLDLTQEARFVVVHRGRHWHRHCWWRRGVRICR